MTRRRLIPAVATLVGGWCAVTAWSGTLPVVETRTFRSASLGQERAYNVLLPVGYATGGRRYPVLYLLHGRNGDHTDWAERTSLREAVRDAELLIVMPNGDARGWYTDRADGADNHESQIVRDLLPHVDATYRTIARREGRAVAGLSMGGYGALKLALKHPELFVAAASHSGAVTFAREKGRDAPEIFGTGAEGAARRRDNDVLRLAAGLVPRNDVWNGPALYLDCGTEDYLYDANLRLRTLLRELSIPYEYHEFPGGHSWNYWNARLPAQLRFTLRHLAPAEDGPPGSRAAEDHRDQRPD